MATRPDTMMDTSMMAGTLLGRWTYRSFVTNPDIDVDFGKLEFGRGELLIEYLCPNRFIGRLIFGDDYQFGLQGMATPGDPPTIRFRGIGDGPASQGQVYDYLACVMPLWPYDTRQRPTIVGSVVRAVAHNGDRAPAGQAATFIAIKRDLPEGSATEAGESTEQDAEDGSEAKGRSSARGSSR